MAALNPYGICINDGTTYVVISNTKVTITWNNEMKTITRAVSYANRSTTTPETQTMLLNLGKEKKSFEVHGELCEGTLEYSSGNNETKSTAKEKRDALKDLIESVVTLTLIYDGTSYVGAIEKMSITENARDTESTPTDSDAVYSIILLFVVGEDKIAS